MNSFQMIVIGIALFLLIFILVIVGMMMRDNKSSKTVFPPVKQACPDLWMNDNDGNCYYVGKNKGSGFNTSNNVLNYEGASNFPVYVYNQANGWTNSSGGSTTQPKFTGNSTPTNLPANYAIFNTSDPQWTSGGKTAVCQQKTFSNNNNIYWDGISNTNQC